jgi:predicted RND superfamily exporter protein
MLNWDTPYVAIAAGVVLFMLIVFQKSLFLALSALVCLFFSFSVTVIICEQVFKISYYGELHIAFIFLVIGLTAEDYFVFIDIWRRSKTDLHVQSKSDRNEASDKVKMAYTWNYAASNLLVSTLVKAITFISLLASNIMPLKAIGVHGCVLIVVNYLLIIIFLPASIIWYKNWIENIELCSHCYCCGCGPSEDEEEEYDPAAANSIEEP